MSKQHGIGKKDGFKIDRNLGYKVFSIIEAKVVELDILELNYSGHVRVKMEVQNGDLISSRWIMP